MFLPKILIHIPKNGGMTVRKSPVLGRRVKTAGPAVHKSLEYTEAVEKKMNSLGDHHGFEHSRWRDCKRSIVEGHGSFAIVRNPWSRVVSRYMFAKKVIEVEQKVPESYADTSSFEAFLEERHKWGGEKYMWHRAVRGWYTQLDYLIDNKGVIQPDVLIFEKMNIELQRYFRIPKMSEARNVTGYKRSSYKDLYTPETIQIIADWYKDDIDTFGFDFDTGATKNTWSTK